MLPLRRFAKILTVFRILKADFEALNSNNQLDDPQSYFKLPAQCSIKITNSYPVPFDNCA